MFTLADYILHAIDRDYMSGVERDRARIKASGEVFTPNALVREMLMKLGEGNSDAFTDPSKTFCDPSCGDGNFLVGVVLYKLTKGVFDLDTLPDDYWDRDLTADFGQALRTTYGVDIMPDNVRLTKERLLCGQEQFRHVVDKNIVCADALTYDFSFE